MKINLKIILTLLKNYPIWDMKAGKVLVLGQDDKEKCHPAPTMLYNIPHDLS